MQTSRFKVQDRSNDWKCCFCCHVRTGTIFFGIWHLMLHVLALSMLAVVLRHPELVSEQLRPDSTALSQPTLRNDGSELPLRLGQPPRQMFPLENRFNPRIYNQDINTCVILTFFMSMITLLMVYGAIKGRPTCILPFFILQVLDFFISSSTAVAFILYMPDVHRLIGLSRIPYQAELLQLNEQALCLIVLLTILFVLLLKAYFIGVVWSCYKYLMLRAFPSQRTIHYIDTESLLPSYDAAVKKFPTPPPSYATATRDHPAPPTTTTATATVDSAMHPPPPLTV